MQVIELKTALVGYTGFVGSNLCLKKDFDLLYNSKNIDSAFGSEPDLLVYAGVRAEKYLANRFPEKDMENILEAQKNIERISPKKLVLISTIDVINDPVGADENTQIKTEGLQPYGSNRYHLEKWVRQNYNDALIIRLPALFGQNLKKNFIYDMINIIPSKLTAEKLNELSKMAPKLLGYYKPDSNGFFKAAFIEADRKELERLFLQIGFSALNFTDSRSIFQFYPLYRLWDDICTLLKQGITLFHPATEPVSAASVYSFLTGKEFTNKISKEPLIYDYRTLYAELFGGKNGYIESRQSILNRIKEYYQRVTQRRWGIPKGGNAGVQR